MKLEPLKNKGNKCYHVKNDGGIWYNHYDVKSAVKWLKYKLDFDYPMYQHGEKVDIIDLIDEAFPDMQGR